MIIKSVHLNNFRNYGRLDLEVGPSVNIFYGFNAQGKTNVIEAVNVCSCLSSHRTSKDKDMVKFGENDYSVNLKLKDEVYGSDTELQVDYYGENSDFTKSATPKRVLSQDGMTISKTSLYLGICNTVMFAPEDLNLIKGSPSVRRKFLNILISRVSPTYFNLLNKYNRLIEQKNLSLKLLRGKDDKGDSLDFWDFSLAEISSEIILNRYFYVKLLSEHASMHHGDISENNESLTLSYNTVTGAIELLERLLLKNDIRPDISLLNAPTAVIGTIKDELSSFLLSKLKNCRHQDIEKGVSSIGVHKDDLDISLNDLSMKIYSSQGQQRSAALSLKLSELDIIRDNRSSSPILLLDDVFSELDEKRRRSLISGIINAQIFITCTDKSYITSELQEVIGNSADIRFFHVDKGVITPE